MPCRAALAAVVRLNRGGDLPSMGWLLPSAHGVMESEGCLFVRLQKPSERNRAPWKMKLPLAGERDLG